MSMQLQTQVKAASQPSFTPVRSGLLRRKCACGGTPGLQRLRPETGRYAELIFQSSTAVLGDESGV